MRDGSIRTETSDSIEIKCTKLVSLRNSIRGATFIFFSSCRQVRRYGAKNGESTPEKGEGT
jgi:hypothetical protein